MLQDLQLSAIIRSHGALVEAVQILALEHTVESIRGRAVPKTPELFGCELRRALEKEREPARWRRRSCAESKQGCSKYAALDCNDIDRETELSLGEISRVYDRPAPERQ